MKGGEPLDASRISTGSAGLDAVLRGGLPDNRVYLLEGAPGSGKTTLALRYLLEGVGRGERVLYVTLSETSEELEAVAASHGWSLDGVDLFELASANEVLGDGREQSILYPWEMELGGTVRLIQEKVEEVRPSRVVFDSLSEMRLLAQDPLRYRRQVLALKQFFVGRHITVVLVDDLTGENGQRDAHLHSLCHGVISLERLTLDFGAARRRLEVQKLRGVDFVAGFHDFTIRTGGLEVYPRLIATEHQAPFAGDPTPSGVIELDNLLAGGPLRGTSTLVTGPAGAGKTTVALQYLYAACERGEASALFEFDERVGTLLVRARAMGLDLQKHIDSGVLTIMQIDPAEISPGEFAWTIRRQVEDRSARVLVIDSLIGYLASMPQEEQLILQMHELLSYLNHQGVVTFLIYPQAGLVGGMGTGTLNISYVADAVILIRFFEVEGRLRKAISIIKNRGGAHEDTIRELRIDARGIRVGEPLTAFKGVMTGTPQYAGDTGPLMEPRAVGD
ncbi:Non-specific serine/threonine protein kinase [Methylocella silvestris BL2]|uniref:non-specific serine/threonine protein kinase n=1 Tax=Methylocella silvestris (strain DSM 15510 / CIP 108128 / LMG 27833 / NCIMB 13906 / BL2) TaxID=395965 RepID=B8ES00_METSB|nr:ATPase domain-containing protein [Methylocella silvestris]ACK51698.1 Non-specific serine/threonine protein kinase [Methylocella silvestris BL2]